MENKKDPSKEKIPYAVTPMGSLGLLAVGYKGLIAWREAKKEFLKQQQEGKDEPKKD